MTPLAGLALVAAAPAGAAPEACARSSDGGVLLVTCSGDQSQGIRDADLGSRPAGTREILLRVRALSGPIPSPVGARGVFVGEFGTQTGDFRAEIETGAAEIAVAGANATAIGIETAAGDAALRLAGSVRVSGPSGLQGLVASVGSGAGNASAAVAPGATVAVAAEGPDAIGVKASAGRGDATVESSGRVAVRAAEEAVGLSAASTLQNAAIAVRAGVVEVTGTRATGVTARATDIPPLPPRFLLPPPLPGLRLALVTFTPTEPGTATVRIDAGARVVARGKAARAISAAAGSGGSIEVAVAGTAEAEGPASDDAASTAVELTAAGDIELTASGRIAAAGEGAVGIGATSGGRIELRFDPGAVVVAPTVVRLIGGSSDPGAPNRLTIAPGAVVRGAIAAGLGSEWLENRGRLDLEGGSDFGAGTDHLENRGRLNPGGRGRIATVSVAGLETLRQRAEGVLEIDLDPLAGAADGIELAGPTAVDLAGRVEVREQREDLRLGTQSYTLLTTGGSLRAADLAVTGTAARRYALVAAENELRLQRAVSFRPPGLRGPTAQDTGAYIERIAEESEPGDPLVSGLLAPLLEIEAVEAYGEALGRLQPRPYEALLQASWYAEQSLVEALWRGCEGVGTRDRGKPCLWGGLAGRQLERRAPGRDGDFSSRSIGARGGVRSGLVQLGRLPIAASFGWSYEAAELELARGGRADGDRLLGAVGLHGALPLGYAPRHRELELELDFAADGGFSWYRARRRVAFAGVATARSEPEVAVAGLHGRVALRWGGPRGEPGLYARLGVEGNAVYIGAEDLDETGAGALALRVDPVREVIGTVRPGVEVGSLWRLGSLTLRPHARLAGSLLVNDADARLRSRLVAAPRRAGTARLRGEMDRRLIDVEAGLALAHGEHLALRLGYRGRFAVGGDTRSHEGSLLAEFRF